MVPLQKTIDALTGNGFTPLLVQTKEEALVKIKELIPAGASVTQGSSVTLQEIGYIDYLKTGKHGWNNLHEKVLAEKDPIQQAILRKQMTVADFYLGSTHALTQDGQLVFASNTGSQLPSIAYNARNLIIVVGIQKIVPDIASGLIRIDTVVAPREDDRLFKANGAHTLHAKTLILHKENTKLGRSVHVLIVAEPLGF